MSNSVSRVRREASKRWVQGAKVIEALGHERDRRALRLGVASAREHRGVLRRLSPRTVIDVGANRGQFALEVRRSAPDASVISFEPLPAAADVFDQIFAGEKRVGLHRLALAAEPGTARLHVSRADDSSSLLAISDQQSLLFPGTDEVAAIEVEQTTLDQALADCTLRVPTMLKIDVQGGELDVLRGAGETMQLLDWVYVECSFRELYLGQPLADDVIEHLRGTGFRLDGLGHVSSVGGEAIQADMLFRKIKPA